MPTPTSAVAARPVALLAAGLVLVTSGCGGSGSTPAPTVTVTATQTAPATPSAAASSPADVPASSSPRASMPGAEGTCAAERLKVRYADDRGGAGAGSVAGTLTFTNDGSSACVLQGFPGVSYVAGSRGTQVGQAATRTDGRVEAVRLAPGGRATAPLRRTQPRNYAGTCDPVDVDGLRVYPPGSTAAVFVRFPTTGCRSQRAPLLQVGPVQRSR